MPRRAIPAELKRAVLGDIAALGGKPTRAQAEEIGQRHGLGARTVERWATAGRAVTDPPPDPSAGTPTPAAISLHGTEIAPEAMPQLTGAPIAPAQPAQPAAGAQPGTAGTQAVVANPTLAMKPLATFLCDLFNTRATAIADEGATEDGPPNIPPITDEEKQALAEALEAAAAKYAPLMAEHMVEINLVIVLAAVFGPRLWAVKERRAWRNEHRGMAPHTPAPAHLAPNPAPVRAPLPAPAGSRTGRAAKPGAAVPKDLSEEDAEAAAALMKKLGAR